MSTERLAERVRYLEPDHTPDPIYREGWQDALAAAAATIREGDDQ